MGEVIIIGGDSWSDVNFKSVEAPEGVGVIWSDFLGFEDATFIHTGRCGACNTRIVNRVLDAIYREPKVDRVIIGLSDWLRFTSLDISANPRWTIWVNSISNKVNKTTRLDLKKSTKIVAIQNNFEKNGRSQKPLVDMFHGNGDNKMRLAKYSNIAIDDHLRSLWTLVNICQSKGIKLDIFQMLVPFSYHFHDPRQEKKLNDEILKFFISHPLFKKLELVDNTDTGVNLIDWPWDPSIGGGNVDSMFSNELRISDKDSHPNALGHEFIGKWIRNSW